jgi:beta-mannosidase
MEIFDLQGEWNLKQSGKNLSIKAKVPGNVHSHLLAAGTIPDPYFRDNETKLQWIGEADWVYSRTFDITPDFLNHQVVILRCFGLDTLAAVKVNSVEIGQTDNMFRTYELNAKSYLKSGRNTIEICLVLPYPKSGKVKSSGICQPGKDLWK